MTGEFDAAPRALRVLVVDDNPAIARFLCRTVRILGHDALPPCHSLDDLHARLRADGPDLLFLDIDLHGRSSVPVMTELAATGMPIVCISGYSAAVRPTPPDIPRLHKPIDGDDIAAALARLAAPQPGSSDLAS